MLGEGKHGKSGKKIFVKRGKANPMPDVEKNLMPYVGKYDSSAKR